MEEFMRNFSMFDVPGEFGKLFCENFILMKFYNKIHSMKIYIQKAT